MKKQQNDIELGKFISLILRHKPEVIGITLDENGWADTQELLSGINASGRYIDLTVLERIVRENNKKRYSFNEDKTKIRANQGHSVHVDVEMKEMMPPDELYHGTAERFLKSIREKGILKMNRQYVHLSTDVESAKVVGKRHGKPVVLVIDTKKMVEDGYHFWLSDNGVWQSEEIKWEYVKATLAG
ncbi:MAG: RNA 2'-phosphotransferase [Lachnospiraceae bacterium]|nr:RNA 2'-phosphotransferase [Lachnospiraceae bacterium]